MNAQNYRKLKKSHIKKQNIKQKTKTKKIKKIRKIETQNTKTKKQNG